MLKVLSRFWRLENGRFRKVQEDFPEGLKTPVAEFEFRKVPEGFGKVVPEGFLETFRSDATKNNINIYEMENKESRKKQEAKARREKQEARSKEQGAGKKERGRRNQQNQARSKEQGTGKKERGRRNQQNLKVFRW